MSEQVALYRALEQLGRVAVFREEAHELAFNEALAELKPSDTELAREEGGEVALADKTKAELLAIAEARGLDVNASDTKAELVEAIEAAEGEGG